MNFVVKPHLYFPEQFNFFLNVQFLIHHIFVQCKSLLTLFTGPYFPQKQNDRLIFIHREDDVASEIQALSLQTKGNEDSEEEDIQPVKKKKVIHTVNVYIVKTL